MSTHLQAAVHDFRLGVRPLLLERSKTRRRGCLRSPGQELPKTIISIYALVIRTSVRGRLPSSYLRCVCFPCHTPTAERDIDLPARPSIWIEFCPVARSDDGRAAFCSHGADHSMRPPFPHIAPPVTRPRSNLARAIAIAGAPLCGLVAQIYQSMLRGSASVRAARGDGLDRRLRTRGGQDGAAAAYPTSLPRVPVLRRLGEEVQRFTQSRPSGASAVLLVTSHYRIASGPAPICTPESTPESSRHLSSGLAVYVISWAGSFAERGRAVAGSSKTRSAGGDWE